MLVEKGYWRKDEYSKIVIYCKNLEANCIGGPYGN